MYLNGGYQLVLLSIVVGVAESCGPSPCSWQTCRHEWRNDWNPGIAQGRCTYQSRRAHHIYTTHNGKGSCPGTQHCSPSSQGRTKCSCRNAYYCPLYNWQSWTGHVPQGGCARQSRYRDYNQHTRYDIRDNNCNNIRSTCGNRLYGYRTWCNCKYAECSLQAWSAWSDLSSPISNDHCASQERRKRYRLTWKYVERRDNCNHGLPTYCPTDVVETREKVIYCPALGNPAHGRWNRDDCSSQRQTCKSICQLVCDVRNGFQLTGGGDTRECLVSGQWRKPWSSYCKDVAPPVITCPASVTVNNDANSASARVTLPQPTATDNSGQPPTVANSAGGSAKDFTISGSPHTVRYTATDTTGNTKSCDIFVTVKDAERPRILTCPPDQHKQTDQHEVRVTWAYPTFQDNYDTQPFITSNKNPGSSFFWGIYPIVYTATDKAGNNASCQFEVRVGPVPCPMFEAPKHGTRTCNKKLSSANGVNYEMICSVQCKQKHAFVTRPANTYLCASSGLWNRVIGAPIPVPPNQKPWPDCAPEEGTSAAMKKFTFYTGSCQNGNDQAALNQIRQNFLEAVRNSPLANFALCSHNNGEDCAVNNVKIYCGSNSKRSVGSQAERIITFDFVIKDTKPTADRKTEAAKVQKMMKDLETLSGFLKQKFPSATNMPSLRVVDDNSTAACPAGQVMKVLSGAGSELERTMCVSCPVGTHYNSDKQDCVTCEEGTFQDKEGQLSCDKCPKGKWTQGAHATSFIDCKDYCDPGEYSVKSSGLATCLACPRGSYQPAARSSSCITCPQGKTTRKEGSARLADCV